MIVVIPTGGSNLGSILSAFARLGLKTRVSDDPEIILAADRVVLAGVGHAKPMMARIVSAGLHEVIPKISRPVLGICLGMQILFEHTEEGDVACLGIIPGQVLKIPDHGLAIPHIGWNTIELSDSTDLTASMAGEYCYFVHSFCASPGPWVKAVSSYGVDIPAVVQWKNFYGAQFHPERSGKAGEDFLKRFVCLSN